MPAAAEHNPAERETARGELHTGTGATFKENVNEFGLKD